MLVDLRGRIDRPPTVPFRYLHALDGLRGIGILMVVFAHYAAGVSEWAGTRFFGVSISLDFFFVLSGYLITTLLLEEWGNNSEVSMRNFYVRRALRLLPALYVFLAVMLAIALFTNLLPRKQLLAEVGAAALYMYPAILLIKGDQAFMFHLWSLSIEEWFYFIWPCLLVFVGLRPRTSARLRLVVGMLVGLVIACFAIRQIGNDDVISRLVGMLRPDSLALGALLAFLARWWKEFPDQRLHRVLNILGPLGCVGYVYFAWFAHFPRPPGLTDAEFHDIAFRSWNYRFGILSCFFMILHIAHRPEGKFSRALSWRPLTFLGGLSYAIYLWHQPLYLLANRHLFRGDPKLENHIERSVTEMWAFGLTMCAISILVALASQRFIERPALAQKSRFEMVKYH
jgi:peptidoglycan/LPS O-acetylase OafA/YrhL